LVRSGLVTYQFPFVHHRPNPLNLSDRSVHHVDLIYHVSDRFLARNVTELSVSEIQITMPIVEIGHDVTSYRYNSRRTERPPAEFISYG